nr:hypothetical protein [Micromonospora sp. DSM 115978]
MSQNAIDPGAALAGREASEPSGEVPAADPCAGVGSTTWWPHLLAGVLLAGAVPVVHDVRAALRLPYWLDEAWVALSVRLPLADLPEVTKSTPLGWTALLRLVPGEHRLRLLPLAFLGLGVLAGYVLGQSLGWRSTWQRMLTGLATGAAVLLLPAQHIRHDLKQYTADAAIALLLLAMVAWLERRWSPWRMAWFVPVVAVGMLISHATAIIGMCALGGLTLVLLARRQWRRLAVTAMVGVGVGAVVLAVYLGISVRGQTSGLEDYWVDYFTDPPDLPAYLARRLGELEPYLGMPWPLLLILAAIGIGVLALTRRPATALAAGLVPVSAVVLGLVDFYPLLDLRTSHFLLVLLIALAGIGAAGTVIWTVGRLVPATARRGSAYRAVIAGAVVLTAAAAFALAGTNDRWLRFDGRDDVLGVEVLAAREDVRTAVRHLDRHRRPGDVILVSALASYGFAMYWPHEIPHVVDNPVVAVGWQPEYPEESGIVIARDRDRAAIAVAIAQARDLAERRGPDTAIWLVRSHLSAAERESWAAELADYQVEIRPSGREPVATVEPSTGTG